MYRQSSDVPDYLPFITSSELPANLNLYLEKTLNPSDVNYQERGVSKAQQHQEYCFKTGLELYPLALSAR